MKFDLNWFTTIPGLLITGGVLLLVIALIIFIVTSVKGKKSKKVEGGEVNNQVQASAQPATVDNNVQQAGVVMQPQVAAVDANAMNVVAEPAPLNTVTPMNAGTVNLDGTPAQTIPVESVPIQQVVPVEAVPVQPVMPEVQPVPVMPVEQPVMPTADEMIAAQQVTPVEAVPVQPVMPEVQPNPVISNEPVGVQNPSVDVLNQQVPTVDVASSIPTVDVNQVQYAQENVTPVVTPEIQAVPVQPAMPEVQPVIPSVTPIEVTPSVEQVVPTVEVAPEVPVLDINPIGYNTPQEPVSIYGGVSPVVPNVVNDINQQPHQIYGGANPLENTQSVPIVNIANDSAYVAQENVAPVEPTINVVPQYTAAPVISPVEQPVQMTAAPVVSDQVITVAQPQVVPVQQAVPQYGQQPAMQPVNQQVMQPGQQIGIQ